MCVSWARNQLLYGNKFTGDPCRDPCLISMVRESPSFIPTYGISARRSVSVSVSVSPQFSRDPSRFQRNCQELSLFQKSSVVPKIHHYCTQKCNGKFHVTEANKSLFLLLAIFNYLFTYSHTLSMRFYMRIRLDTQSQSRDGTCMRTRATSSCAQWCTNRHKYAKLSNLQERCDT